MSFFDSANADSYRGSFDEGSAGPKLGFLESFDAALQATNRAHSLLAVEQGLRNAEQEQIKRIREVGLTPPKSLDESEDIGSGPFGGAQFFQGRYYAAAQSIVDGGGWYTDEMVKERDDHIDRLKKERPDLGLMNYAELFKQVQTQAQEAEQRANLPKTFGGEFGAFAGGIAGAMNPVTNPVNFATLGLGGGATIPARMALQGAFGAGAETIALAVSNPENLLLGQQRTPGEDLKRIGLAAVGGAVGEGMFVGAGAAVRKMRTGRWFADLPEPKPQVDPRQTVPAPEFTGEAPPPMKPGLPLHEYPDWETFAQAHGENPVIYGATRDAVPRVAADLDHVQSELNRWDGPQPYAVRPPEVRPPETATAIPGSPEPGARITTEGARQRYFDSLETVDDIARRIDPDLFQRYDKLAVDMADIRKRIDQNGPTVGREFVAGQANEILRRTLQKLDYEMRDLAPLVTRAYKAADKEWRTTPVDHNTLDFLKQIEDRSGWRYRAPPPEPKAGDTVRVYHGGAHDPKTLDEVHVTTSLDDAQGWAARSGDMKIWYKDVPRSSPWLTKVQEGADALATRHVVPKDGLEGFRPYTPSLTEQPMRPPESRAPAEPPVPTVNDTIPLAEHPTDVDKRASETKDAPDRVKQNAQYVREATDEHVDGFLGTAKKAAAIEADQVAAQAKEIRDAIDAIKKEQRPEAAVDVAELEKKLDALENITFPDGKKMSLDKDRVPFVDRDGEVKEMSVRDYLREMQKDQDALQSVVTCSRPS